MELNYKDIQQAEFDLPMVAMKARLMGQAGQIEEMTNRLIYFKKVFELLKIEDKDYTDEKYYDGQMIEKRATELAFKEKLGVGK